MIKKIIVSGLLLLLLCPVQAQQMKDLFIRIPDSLSLLLTKVNREDFADFLESNMKARVKNRFEGISEMKKLTPDYLFLQETSQSTVEMKLLPVNDSLKVICYVKTACAPACDSRVRFFSTDWKELPASDYLLLPKEDVFYQLTDTTDRDKMERLRAKADMYLLKASLSSDSLALTFTYTVPEYLNEEESVELSPFLRKDPVVLEWKNGRYESRGRTP